jgi:hypothetical protein
MTIQRWPTLIILIILLVVTTVEAAPPGPNDFAYGLSLEVQGKSALWQLSLPATLYRRVTRPDLGDMRVFDAAGHVMPHTLQRPEAPLKPVAPPYAIPFFPLLTSAQGNDRAQTLRVRRDAQGRVVEIINDVVPTSPTAQVTAYLLDLGEPSNVPNMLTLHWQRQTDSGFSTVVHIDHSTDLIHWHPLVQKAILVDLQAGSASLIHRDIVLPKPPLAYLRLSWPQALRHVRLTAVQGSRRQARTAQPRQWMPIDGVRDRTAADTYHYDTGSYWPVDRMRVVFAEANRVAQIRLQSRLRPDDEWQQRFQGLVYALQSNDITVRNEPLAWPTTADRYWRLQIIGADKGEADRAPTLELGWIPHTLTFVAQGEPPYTLAYGSARVGPSEKPVATLLKTLGDARTSPLIKAARAGSERTLGGAERLRPPPAPVPWKQMLLWGVLLLGVAVLGIMVRQLYRQLKADTT